MPDKLLGLVYFWVRAGAQRLTLCRFGSSVRVLPGLLGGTAKGRKLGHVVGNGKT